MKFYELQLEVKVESETVNLVLDKVNEFERILQSNQGNPEKDMRTSRKGLKSHITKKHRKVSNNVKEPAEGSENEASCPYCDFEPVFSGLRFDSRWKHSEGAQNSHATTFIISSHLELLFCLQFYYCLLGELVKVPKY